MVAYPPRDSNPEHCGSEPQASTVGLEGLGADDGGLNPRPRRCNAALYHGAMVCMLTAQASNLECVPIQSRAGLLIPSAVIASLLPDSNRQPSRYRRAALSSCAKEAATARGTARAEPR
jgi:hypothetical protein